MKILMKKFHIAMGIRANENRIEKESREWRWLCTGPAKHMGFPGAVIKKTWMQATRYKLRGGSPNGMDRLPNLFSSFRPWWWTLRRSIIFLFCKRNCTIGNGARSERSSMALIAVVLEVGNDSLVMVPAVRAVLGIQCVSQQVFD